MVRKFHVKRAQKRGSAKHEPAALKIKFQTNIGTQLGFDDVFSGLPCSLD
jgi:hypothetical protein